MARLTLKGIGLAVAAAAAMLWGGTVNAQTPWVVFYGAKAPDTAFEPYQLVVLDSQSHPPLRRLRDRGKTVLGYLSLGEVENHRPWFERVKEWGILGEENPNWKGSFYVDVRDKRWVRLVVEELVPAVLHRGFDGIFIDTLDNPPHLERTDPKRWKGMTEASARLVRTIRRHYPQTRLMLNRAYEILPETAASLDYALGESVYTTWNFTDNRAELQPDSDYRFQVEVLKRAKTLNPKLQVMSLDYWDPDDVAGVRRIYAVQRANGFSPYVSVVALDRIIPEPAK